MSINRSKPARILLLAAPIGAGHIRAAEAVACAINRRSALIECRVLNVFAFLPAWIAKGILTVYFSILRLFPQAYAAAYGWGNDSSLALWGRDLISRYFAKKMQAYFADFKPDIVVCTHATPAGLAAYMRRRGLLDVPLVGVVTDYVVHRLWLYPEVDRYYIPHEDLRFILENAGIGRDKITVTGIPVHADFYPADPVQKTMIARRLHLRTDVPTIMIMGGGAGLLPVESILAALEEIESSLQIIVIAGHNHKLADRLRVRRHSCRHSVLVLGFTSRIPDYMAVSDLLITKPGGMTVAEALCMGLQLLLFRPLPGQEEANAEFLLQRRRAIRADSCQEVVRAVRQMLLLTGYQPETVLLSEKKRAADEIAIGILDISRHMS
ncbi:MGDG synthase family glycosyltransferase [Acetonema longum]|uniref:Monogalactosyldiacylglycerol synthase n=1 Tax=Acetonema longum DSM 6540 TaxID=1009370 RepID=F7NL29_9FIRM|nr:glycosyltransferase [Acetonema longum]EGO63134.1 hypothetical protein ALO_14007 [Acetonema longum DSM 6540]